MSRSFLCCCALLLTLVGRAGFGQQTPFVNNPPDAATSADHGHPGGVEILSDTGGVDVQPYVKLILGVIYRHWTPLIPADAKPPESKAGESAVRFTILPNGRIGAMHLDSSTDDDQINRSCWGAITSTGPFPPLPAGMESKPLELRIHFYVNMQPQ